jgi:hypothetical protein
MAINVDKVYQNVLGILNKEQRGFLPPQEFNLYANQVQNDIFEQYFYEINVENKIHGNSTEYADMLHILNEKIAIFEKNDNLDFSNPYYLEPADLYRAGTLIYSDTEIEQVRPNELLYILKSPIAKPSDTFPIYIKDQIGWKVYGDALFDGSQVVSLNYVRVPSPVVWGYTSVLKVPQYNASASTNFELHPSEENDVIIKILALAGLEIKDLSVYQTATQEDRMNTMEEKGQ